MTLVARSGALSDIGLHRKTNEDTFVVAPPLYIVCDGMGGAQAGEVASSIAAQTLAAAVADGVPLLEAAERANTAVHTRASEDPDHSGMGTTLTAFVLEGDTGHFVHIGDSRAYLLRGGELQQVSDDHSLVGEMMRDGRLTEDEAAVHPHRSILSRALGTEAQATIDEFEVDLLAGDVVLLCSDGLSGPVTAAAIARALGREDPDDAAARLIAEARKQGGPDNITAVVVHVDAEVTPDAAGTELPPDAAADLLVVGAAAAALDETDAPADPATSVAAVDAADAAADPAAGAAAPGAAPEGDDDGLGEGADEDALDAAADGPDAGFDDDSGDEAAAAAARPAPRRGFGCLVMVLVLVVLLGVVGAVTLSTVFYVGIDDGRLAVYSGLPVTVGPVHLHAVYRRSARSYSALDPAEQAIVDAHALHTRGDAMALSSQLGMWP